MRKSISLLLSAIMIVFTAFIPVIGISASNETQYSQTLNSYDDGNFYYEVDADVVTRAFNVNADGSKGRLNNLFSCNMAVANGNGIDGGMGVKSKNIICTTSDPANWLNMVRIYDSNLKNTLFKPKSGATYKISFKYKTTKTETRDINFGIRGLINATGNLDQNNSKSIALLATHTKNAKATGDWKTVNAVFSVSDTEGYNGLSFAVYVTDTGNYIPNGDVFIDDIEIAEYVPDYTLNDYDGGNFYYEVDADVVTRAFNVNADGSKGRLNNLFSCNMAVANGNGIDGGMGVKSKNIICTTSDPANWLNMVRIYDSNLKNTLFKPKAGATYKISFKYKTTETETRDINFGIRGLVNATGSLDQNNTKSIALLASHAKNTKATGDWKTASAVFSISEASQYNGLGFSVYVTGSANYIPNGDIFIDDIEIEIRETKYVSVVCHDFSENGEDKIINILNTANFDELEVPYVAGKKFDGWYLDSKLSKPAVGEIGKTAEVWVKWRTEPISIVNNYDESGIFYIKESYNYFTRSTNKNGTDNIDSELSFSKFANGEFLENGGFNGSRAFGFTSASHSANEWPVAVRIYDSNSKDKTVFKPTKYTTYEITLKYNVEKQFDWAELYLNICGMSASNKFKGEKLATVLTVPLSRYPIDVGKWLSVKATFSVTDSDYESLGLFLATGNSYSLDCGLLIDDITVTEVLDSRFLFFDSASCGNIGTISFLPGSEPINLPIPKRDGKVFCGWYTDADYNKPYSVTAMPEKNITLYAKWADESVNVEGFSCGFEENDSPYVTSETSKSDNIVSEGTTCLTDEEPDTEGRFIRLAVEKSSDRLSSAALVKSDGSYYQVKAGQRYKVSLSVRGDNERNTVGFLISEQVPSGGINRNNSVTVLAVSAVEHWDFPRNEWGKLEACFIPEKSGRIYIVNYAKSKNYSLCPNPVDVDNLIIEPVGEDEVVVVDYYNEDGSVLTKSVDFPWNTMLTPVPKAKKGYDFAGWSDENGKIYTATVFPNNDLKLYATYKKSKDTVEQKSDYTSVKIIDFEGNTDEIASFYRSNANCYVSDAFLQTNANGESHSGSNYFRFYHSGNWIKESYRRMRVYDPDSDGNMLYLDSHSIYKISFWLRIDNIAVGSLKLAALDTTSSMNIINSEDVVSMSAQESEDSYGEWIKYDYTMTTGEDITTLGFVLFGGYLDGGIDDISVEKIKPVTVTYETNGGSKVAASKAMTYDYIVPPVEPEKEGYVFEGWYSDRELKNRFNFKKQYIVADMVLYAKWIPVKETVYKDVYSFTESEQTIETEIPDKHLDEQIIIRKNDTVKKTEPVNKTEERQNILQFIIIATAAIVVIAGGTVAVILLRRKRKDGRK